MKIRLRYPNTIETNVESGVDELVSSLRIHAPDVARFSSQVCAVRYAADGLIVREAPNTGVDVHGEPHLIPYPLKHLDVVHLDVIRAAPALAGEFGSAEVVCQVTHFSPPCR